MLPLTPANNWTATLMYVLDLQRHSLDTDYAF
jgi:hypothetical protein